ncbi:CDP-diacylglycerol--glycerol-3-phosphate 3-phosphatidyltransferase [Collibacillus ludicampi]|uniref:CDP-diacylglycerol--glycerol-3-phosphate 3-phosphatidyltransferase n=1 Tax=Collibacillus ludicampi TaxID=2771369 RepID=A0AAV4LDD9_9BACL|nr:CDP-diacylglycerol--glycerol-3-phosphate 3-phosphatidyltransferase [Collibacillus ludicampi]GIM45678.1 CDP-diacylglycerol--glycerol-3-phosphate 3-phosphatidyltransferase [Collibacillus ludicampi]
MNLPNLLTLIRFALIPVYFLAFFSDSPYNMIWALTVLLFAGLTDILDGYLARKYKLVTELGIMLDPLADKLTMLAVILSFIISGRISWLAAALLITRDVAMIVVSGVFHLRGKKTVPATIWGKTTTVFYYISLVAIMFQLPLADSLLWCTILLSLVTSFVYLGQFVKLNNRTLL